MKTKREGDLYKPKVSSIEINTTIQAIPTNKNILFYRKSCLKNTKNCFYYHKKGNKTNLVSNNSYSYITNYKTKQKNINYTTAETYQSSKGKTINSSKNKYENDSNFNNSIPDRYILKNKSISPISQLSNESYKENKNINNTLNNKHRRVKLIKYSLERNNSNLNFNHSSKIKNDINNTKINSIMNYNNMMLNNKNNLNSKFNQNKELRNFRKSPINYKSKLNNNKEQKDLLNKNILLNIDSSYNKYHHDNNSNPIILNNSIKTENNNYLIFNKTRPNQLGINNNFFDINNDIKNNNQKQLVKGKIIKFKYNGTEFFIESSKNKNNDNFYKKNFYNNEEVITSANLIKKWWNKTLFIKTLILKNKFKYIINFTTKLLMKKWFRYIRFKVLHLKEIIYIQKFWREVLLLKKEKSSIYIKNETYGCDNSYRKNNENLFMTNSEFINSIDDSNSNKNYYKNYKNNKTNIKFSDVFFRNLSNKNLFSPQVIFNSNRNKDNHEDLIKITIKNPCFFSKINYKNSLDKIILIQRKIKSFIKYKYYSYIKDIYKAIFENRNKLYKNELNDKLNKKFNNNINITSQYFDILSIKRNNFLNSYNIFKNCEINFKGIKLKHPNKINIFNTERNNQILYKPAIWTKNKELKECKITRIIINSAHIKFSIKRKTEINFSIIANDYKSNSENPINRPIINIHCFYKKLRIIKAHINNEEPILKKIIFNYNCFISKFYKTKDNYLSYIIKIEKKFKNIYEKNRGIAIKQIQQNEFITKVRKKYPKMKRFYKLRKKNSLKEITKNENNKRNQIYFNNIDEFLQEKDGEKINDVTKYNTINNSHRHFSNERNSNLLNDTDENKNGNPIRILNAKIQKSSISYNGNNQKNIQFNYTPNNNFKYINIESLPSINSSKTENDIFFIETNKMNNSIKLMNNVTNISIQTLGSKASKNKFRENIKYMKRLTTEGSIHKKKIIDYEIKDCKNYFSTDNGEKNLYENSNIRKNLSNNFIFIRYINKRTIKIFCIKIKNIQSKIPKYYFIQMLLLRIKKHINVFVYNKIFNKKIDIDFYKIIRRHINTYNHIMKEANTKNKYENNELLTLMKNNIFQRFFKSNFLFLTEEQENNFINKEIFISNDKDLINYFLIYYSIEYKALDTNYFNMIQFRLIKEPLKNMNIFSITKYMNDLYNSIIHNNICKNCFCKLEESCFINCNCHIKKKNSINLINRIKNRMTRIAHNKSFNDTKNETSFFEEKNKYNERNIKITIKKIKKISADNSRIGRNNFEGSIDSKNSNDKDIDIFQKINTGIESLINKVKINKAFKDFNINKKKKIVRTATEFTCLNSKINARNNDFGPSFADSENNNFNKNNYTTPDKKSYALFIEKKLLNKINKLN